MKINSIRIKLVSIIVGLLVASTVATLFLSLENQRVNLLEATEITLSTNTDILNQTIRNIMLSGEAPIAVRTMAALRTIDTFKDVAIYRIDGSIAFNDFQTIDFVNTYQNKIAFQRTPRVERLVFDDPAFKRVLAWNAPERVESAAERTLEYYFPILNAKECRGCHGERPFVRGVAHFKVSVAGIYEQISAAGGILTGLLVGSALFIAGLLILSLQRMIVSPILVMDRAAREVGQGRLDTRVALRSRDELGDLGVTFNDMIAGLKQRNELMLENEIIDARNRENRKYLDTIQEGLLLVGPDRRISQQYSLFLTRLFETEEIAGLDFVDFIFPDPRSQAAERAELVQFLDFLFKNTASDIEMILQINPLKNRSLRLERGAGWKEITFDALFHRIFEGERVVNVMVIFEDRTELVQARRELEAERERSQGEIEHIAAILRLGPRAYADFTDQAEQALAGVEADLAGLGDRELVQESFRRMHSLKGSARYFQFREIENAAHAVEDVLALSRDSGRPPAAEAIARLREELAKIRAELAAIRALNERFRDFAAAEASSPEERRRRALLAFARDMKRMAEGIAAELGKQVEFKAFGELADEGLLAALREPLIHLVRNALDHGLEDKLERLAAGKPPAGRVSISFSPAPDGSAVKVADDGRGIDFDAVRRRAERMNLPEASSADQRRLLALLFRPDFSSKERAGSISGRGVGLDAVEAAARRLGGTIQVATEKGRGTEFRLWIPAAKRPA